MKIIIDRLDQNVNKSILYWILKNKFLFLDCSVEQTEENCMQESQSKGRPVEKISQNKPQTD
jgi:hypothetical protein